MTSLHSSHSPQVRPRPAVRGSRRGSTLITTLALAAGAFLTASPVPAQESGIAVGATAPGAAVVTLDGQPVDLARFIGKSPVVLEFWATWCPLCRQLEPSMAAAQMQYAGKVTFVSVGVPDNQTPARQKAYAQERHIGGELVFDRDRHALTAYMVPHTSYVVVIDAAGTVVYTGVGGEQDIPTAVAKAFAMKGKMMDGMQH